MTVVAFVLDTSASMNQRIHTGLSYLDLAKIFVDLFIKVARLYCQDFQVLKHLL